MTQAAQKQKRYRERKKNGLYVLDGKLAIHPESLVRICEAGLIPERLLLNDSDTLDAISSWLDFCSSHEALKALARVMLDKLQEFE